MGQTDGTTEPTGRAAGGESSGRRRSRLRTWLFAVCGVVLVLVLAVGGFVVHLSHSWDANTSRVSVTSTPGPGVADGPGTNILLLGTDTRGAGDRDLGNVSGTRSDVIMVAHVPDDGGGVQLLSLPRDLWVDIEGHGRAKLNAAMSYGGPELAVSTVSGLLGSTIEHVAVIDFEGFRSVTDALGGVDVMVYEEFSNGSVTFPEGLNHLDGEKALTFVRTRYAFADGDFRRMRNQQSLVKSLIAKMSSAGTLSNPATLLRVVRDLSPYVTVDDGLDARGLGSLALGMRDVKSSEFRFATLPTGAPGTSETGEQYLSVDEGELDRVRSAFAHDTLDELVQRLD